MSARTHYLKTVQPHFDNVLNGTKTFELRKNDRGFKVGDMLVLQEYITPSAMVVGGFTGRVHFVCVCHALYDFEAKGIEEGYAVLSIKDALS